MNGVLERHWTVAEAAQLLGVSERHAWRILAAYRKEGAAALAHGNRNRLPLNTTPMAVQTKIIQLARGHYSGLNHTHFTELLEEREGITVSRSTVRRLLMGAGVSSPRQRRSPCHRYRRARMPQEGMLVQIDGSHHQWLGEQIPRFTLLLAVDDATGTVPYALFQEQEDTEGYFRLMKGMLQRHGIPLAVYSDRYFVFCYSKPGNEPGEAPMVDKGKPTQFGRAMRELGVTQVFARSPEAKGRVERANGTFQDRLVSELRLAGARTIEDANSVLETFVPRFNERFGVPPAELEPGYRVADPEMDIDTILCIKERRRVAKDNTVQYHRHTLQIFPGADRTSYARAHVEVQQRLDGRLLIYYQGKILTPQEAPPLAISLRAHANDVPQRELSAESEDLKSEPVELQPRIIWYEDSAMRQAHSELVKAGMVRARQRGMRIGRPRVSEGPEFIQRFTTVTERIALGVLSKRQAAKELGIGYATLARLLDAKGHEPDQTKRDLILVTGSY